MGGVTQVPKPITPIDLMHILRINEPDDAEPIEHARPIVCSDSKVLVVEDNEINQELIADMLEQLGYCSGFAGNGKEALDLLRENQDEYSMVIMDCQMPVMDGIEATSRIRNGEAGRGPAKLPILAITANAMAGDREVCIKAGMDDYMPKPIDYDVLEQKLRGFHQ